MRSHRLARHVLPILAGLFLLPASIGAEPPPALRRVRMGAELRVPTDEEARRLGLAELARRWQGLIVVSLLDGGPADRAGVRLGDACVAFEANDLHSLDDADDVLRIAPTGAEIDVRVCRDGVETTVRIALAAEPPVTDAIAWRFAGLGQLMHALETAQREDRLLLVGLSGAET